MTNPDAKPTEYGLSSIPPTQPTRAPQLDYLPHCPPGFRPPIALIGAGGITESHLRAYRRLGLDVVAICDIRRQQAERRQAEFFPLAEVYEDYREVLARDDVQVVDIATHPAERVPIMEAALRRRKHVLSQKPFVTDLDVGQRLVELADQSQVRLAVNQNGRWAPHFGYMWQAVRQGIIGPVSTIDFTLQWDHTWTVDTPFNEVHHLILYDFAIHWFDIATALLGSARAETVYASVRRAAAQAGKPPFLAHAVIDYPHAQVRLACNAQVVFGQEDRTVVAGPLGTLRAFGPGLNDQQVQLWTDQGIATPTLEGNWFQNGFEGTMAELLSAIAQQREPTNSARENLRSLELCFAAVKSADSGEPVRPGQVRRLG